MVSADKHAPSPPHLVRPGGASPPHLGRPGGASPPHLGRPGGAKLFVILLIMFRKLSHRAIADVSFEYFRVGSYNSRVAGSFKFIH